MRPIEYKYSVSNLFKLVSHRDYREYCYNSEVIQNYWRAPEYVLYPMNEPMQQPVPVLCSNINPGDLFSPGKGEKVGIVSGKTTVIQTMLPPDRRKPSIHPTDDCLTYQIHGELGGFFYEQPHEEMTSGFFKWLPLPMQLLAIGMDREYGELNAIALLVARWTALEMALPDSNAIQQSNNPTIQQSNNPKT